MAEEENNAGNAMTPDQEVAFHQGALNALLKEKQGLMQILHIVEATIQGHVQRMKQLGVDFESAEAKEEKK